VRGLPYGRLYDEGEQAYREALAILESARTPDPLALATLFHNLGGLEHARGRCGDGETWARRGLDIREAALGLNHADVASDLAALAALLDGHAQIQGIGAAASAGARHFRAGYGP